MDPPNALAVSNDHARAILIETISRNVMAWTDSDGRERHFKADQLRTETNAERG